MPGDDRFQEFYALSPWSKPFQCQHCGHNNSSIMEFECQRCGEVCVERVQAMREFRESGEEERLMIEMRPGYKGGGQQGGGVEDRGPCGHPHCPIHGRGGGGPPRGGRRDRANPPRGGMEEGEESCGNPHCPIHGRGGGGPRGGGPPRGRGRAGPPPGGMGGGEESCGNSYCHIHGRGGGGMGQGGPWW